ncbi:uncharacterized protein [Magallana gigas]|uniref:uncharacterized protein n=1 Tax=Magallana gigas TaxID=29159 RepID=UPI00333FC752
MKKRTHTILFLGVLSFILQITRGDYDVLVRFLEYNRNQDACDLLFVSGVECDVYFRVCLQPLSPGQWEICRRKNSNILLENTHYFLFSPAQKEDYTFRWGNIRGEPIFNILIKVFDLDPVGEDDFLGTTSYNHVGSGPIVRNVTTTPADMNLRVKFMLEIKCSSRPCESTSTGLTSTNSKSLFTTLASTPSQSTSTRLIPSRSKSISITRASTRGKSTSPGLISTRSKIVYTTRASTPGKSTSTARTFTGFSSAPGKTKLFKIFINSHDC